MRSSLGRTTLPVLALAFLVFPYLATFPFLAATKATASIPEKPTLSAPEILAVTRGYAKHRDAFAEINPGMDIDSVKKIIVALADPNEDMVRRIPSQDDPQNKFRIFWKWNNSFLEGPVLIQEVSEFGIYIVNNKVMVVTIDYTQMTPDIVREEAKMKGSRSFIESIPPPGNSPQEKK